jgi:Type III secretion system YscX (type_III_YscX)
MMRADESPKFDALNFERGIEGTSRTRGEAIARQPTRSELPPADAGMRSQLDQLFAQHDLDDFLPSGIKPDLDNRGLLIPAEFRRVLDNATRSFQQAAQRSGGDGKTLRRAVAVLNEAQRLLEYHHEKCSELFLG